MLPRVKTMHIKAIDTAVYEDRERYIYKPAFKPLWKSPVLLRFLLAGIRQEPRLARLSCKPCFPVFRKVFYCRSMLARFSCKLCFLLEKAEAGLAGQQCQPSPSSWSCSSLQAAA